MEHRRFGSDCVIRIQKGEEILAALRQVCTQENIVLASVNGIGAVNDVTLGVFNSKKFVYESTRYTGDMEIVSCMGNVTQKDGVYPAHHRRQGRARVFPRGGPEPLPVLSP